jgi:transcriptional regulator with XRE-family HTH domain
MQIVSTILQLSAYVFNTNSILNLFSFSYNIDIDANRRKNMDYKAMGKRLKIERCNLNLTQEQLAEEVGLSPAYIGQIERGERNISLDKLILIVNKLGVTVDYVLQDSFTLQKDEYDVVLQQLLKNKSVSEKILVINMLKLIFNYTKEK